MLVTRVCLISTALYYVCIYLYALCLHQIKQARMNLSYKNVFIMKTVHDTTIPIPCAVHIRRMCCGDACASHTHTTYVYECAKDAFSSTSNEKRHYSVMQRCVSMQYRAFGLSDVMQCIMCPVSAYYPHQFIYEVVGLRTRNGKVSTAEYGLQQHKLISWFLKNSEHSDTHIINISDRKCICTYIMNEYASRSFKTTLWANLMEYCVDTSIYLLHAVWMYA